MKITYAEKIVTNESLLIIPLFENDTFKQLPPFPEIEALKDHCRQLRQSQEFEAKDGQTFFLYRFNKNLPEKIILVGMGSRKKISVARVMSNIGVGIKAALSHTVQSCSFAMHELLNEYTQSVAEAIVLGSYLSGLKYKTGDALQKLLAQRIHTIELIGEFDADQKSIFEKGAVIASATNDVRDWVNAPPNYAHADFFEARAREIAKLPRMSLRVLEKSKLEKLNMGAFLGVNRGSSVDAQMLILEYVPKQAPHNGKPILLIGKGILFDSGGYNLKPSGHIEDMHLDKSGAAAVLAVMKVLAQLNYPRKVVAITPLTDNSIGPKALRPSEIVTTYSGKTIEVLNTDGEGRLILSDAIAYGIDIYKPEMVIDVATLTGACMIALGERFAGLFSNDETLANRLFDAGQKTDELLWKMPIHEDDAAKMKGVYADLRNSDTGTSRLAGASKGAAFLKEFVGETSWAHLDIAGPAFVSDPKHYESKGATGFGVRVITKFLEGLALK